MTDPTVCQDCGVGMHSPAEEFLHAKLHSGSPEWSEWGNAAKLNRLPYVLFPVVARLMEAYAKEVTR